MQYPSNGNYFRNYGQSKKVVNLNSVKDRASDQTNADFFQRVNVYPNTAWKSA